MDNEKQRASTPTTRRHKSVSLTRSHQVSLFQAKHSKKALGKGTMSEI
jgi:hypothetical protein